MSHPVPLDGKIVTARTLRVGDRIYSEAGWFDGPEEFNGCWRRITEVKEEPIDSSRDVRVTLEVFPGEGSTLFDHYDLHTLVIVHHDTPNR